MTEDFRFDLDSEQRAVRDRAREVAAQAEAFADEADACRDVHPATRDLLKSSDLVRHAVPAAYGGATERLDPLTLAVVRESLMYASAHLDSLFAMQGVGSYPLTVGGSEELRREWLPRVATLDVIPAIALTEPDVGSDLRAISTTIHQTSDGLVVNGRKSFITNGGVADFYCVLGREGEGYSMVLVPADTPGLRVEAGPDLISPHILGELFFDNAVVPVGNRLGEPGRAFRLMLQTLAVFRVTVAGSAVGVAQAALDEAVRHAVTRNAFGGPLARLGAVSQSLALSWADVETARAVTYRAASLAGQDPLSHLDLSSIAKVSATEAAGRVVDRAVQVMGRFGLIRGAKIERLYRNARPGRIYEGATEVLLDSLARKLVKGSENR